MYTVGETETFETWLSGLKDTKDRIAIARRIERMGQGNFGDHKSLRDGISELRIDVGPGYRVYYTIRGKEIVIVLYGGDKSSQQKDINKAIEILKEEADG